MEKTKGKTAELCRKIGIVLLLFALGGAGYCGIEILYRGYTHWSMALCGGVCFCFIYAVGSRLWGVWLPQLLLISALFITTAELIFGDIFNLVLSLDVWDYSSVPLNFFGQICLPFSVAWFFLSLPALGLCRVLYRLFSGKHRTDGKRESGKGT